MTGFLPGQRVDKRSGSTATVDNFGEAGDSGSIYNTEWPADNGDLWKGGRGCQFGGGGK